MKRRWSILLPSPGVWFILMSYAFAVALVVWGARQPRLDRMQQELESLAVDESATASDWLLGELRKELPHRPRLVAKLAGESGARALEARRDGSVHVTSFHVLLSPKIQKLFVTGTSQSVVELRCEGDALTVTVDPRRSQSVDLPAAWKGRPLIVGATRSGAEGEVRIAGDLGELLP